MRVCRDCGQDENGTEFYSLDKIAGRSAGNCCRQCWIDRSVRRRQNNLEKWNRQRHFKQLEKLHGVTKEQYDEMYKAPICGGCGVTESQRRRYKGGPLRTSRLTMDHDHLTGLLRGMLCHDCNMAIGHAHDDPAALRRLAEYLERHGEQTKVA